MGHPPEFDESTGAIYHYFHDALGSTRLVVASNSNSACYDADFYPYGGESAVTATCAPTYKFTGMMRDGTGDDHTQFRQFMSNFGRWTSPDPLAGDVTDPQSLNRYAYALNSPTNLVDPLGLDSIAPPSGPPSTGWNYCPPDMGSCVGIPTPGGYNPYDVAGPGGVTISTGSMFQTMNSDFAAGEAQYYNNQFMPTFLARCMVNGNCGTSVVLNGGTYTFTGSVVTTSLGGQKTATVTGGWQVSAAGVVGVAGLAGSELGPADVAVIGGAAIYLWYKNADAVKNIVGRMKQINLHLGKLNSSPDQDPRDHWRKEIRDLLKDARKWGNRMSPGKLQDFYMKMIDDAEAAVPED